MLCSVAKMVFKNYIYIYTKETYKNEYICSHILYGNTLPKQHLCWKNREVNGRRRRDAKRRTSVSPADTRPFYLAAVVGDSQLFVGGSPKNMPVSGKVMEEPGRSSQNPYFKSFGPLPSPAPRGPA